ncbi:unnamed protein product, partial [Mesorhabditis spiculigera]
MALSGNWQLSVDDGQHTGESSLSIVCHPAPGGFLLIFLWINQAATEPIDWRWWKYKLFVTDWHSPLRRLFASSSARIVNVNVDLTSCGKWLQLLGSQWDLRLSGSIEDMHRAYGLTESTGNVYKVTCVLKPGEQRTFARVDIDCFLAAILPHHRFVQLRIHQKYVLDAVMMRENAVRIVESVLRLNRENKASKRRFFYVEFSGCALYSWWPKECARFYTNGIFLTPFWKTSTKRDRKNITFYVDSFRCSASWLIGWNYQNSAQLYDDAIRKSVTPGYGSPKRFAHPPFPDNVKL